MFFKGHCSGKNSAHVLVDNSILSKILFHTVLMRNQTKVWKTDTEPLQGEKAWSRDSQPAYFEILQYTVPCKKTHFFWPFMKQNVVYSN